MLAWGANASGQLMDGSTTDRLTPVASVAPAATGVSAIAGGTDFSLLVKH